jgi:hypothetical protein
VANPEKWFEGKCDRVFLDHKQKVDLVETMSRVLGGVLVGPTVLAMGGNGGRKYNLSYYTRPAKDRYTHFAALAGSQDFGSQEVEVDSSSDAEIVTREEEARIGHWLIRDDSLTEVPMAVFIQLSPGDDEWRVNFESKLMSGYPLMFTICMSKGRQEWQAIHKKFNKEPWAGSPTIGNALENLHKIFNPDPRTGKESYMGTNAKSSINIPVHGHPSILLQIWTKHQATFTGDCEGYGVGNERLYVSGEQLMMLRLCATQIQGLLAQEVKTLGE